MCFFLGASDGAMTDTKNADAVSNSWWQWLVAEHYLDQTCKTLAPDKILQGKISDNYSTSAQ